MEAAMHGLRQLQNTIRTPAAPAPRIKRLAPVVPRDIGEHRVDE